jgi:hypothetical protein
MEINRSSNLRLSGVGRAADDGEPFSSRVIELHFDREPTDDELRAIHEHMREFGSAVETKPAASKPISIDDAWREFLLNTASARDAWEAFQYAWSFREELNAVETFAPPSDVADGYETVLQVDITSDTPDKVHRCCMDIQALMLNLPAKHDVMVTVSQVAAIQPEEQYPHLHPTAAQKAACPMCNASLKYNLEWALERTKTFDPSKGLMPYQAGMLALSAEIQRLRNALSQSVETVRSLMAPDEMTNRIAPAGCPVPESQYIANMLESAAEWLNGHQGAVWAEEFGHTDLLRSYALFLWDLRRKLASHSPEEPADELNCTTCGNPLDDHGGMGLPCPLSSPPPAEQPATKPCNCAPDYCLKAGTLGAMMSSDVHCKRPAEKASASTYPGYIPPESTR